MLRPRITKGRFHEKLPEQTLDRLSASGIEVTDRRGPFYCRDYTTCLRCGFGLANIYSGIRTSPLIYCVNCDSLYFALKDCCPDRASGIGDIRLWDMWRNLRERFLQENIPGYLLERFRIPNLSDPNLMLLRGLVGYHHSGKGFRELLNGTGRATGRKGKCILRHTRLNSGPALYLPICERPGLIIGWQQINDCLDKDHIINSSLPGVDMKHIATHIFRYLPEDHRSYRYASFQEFSDKGLPVLYSGSRSFSFSFSYMKDMGGWWEDRKFTLHDTAPDILPADPCAHIYRTRCERENVLRIADTYDQQG